MHDNVSSGRTTTYIVGVRREQVSEVLVEVDGPASPEAKARAEQAARERIGAGEALAWASVGEPFVFDAQAVDVEAAA